MLPARMFHYNGAGCCVHPGLLSYVYEVGGFSSAAFLLRRREERPPSLICAHVTGGLCRFITCTLDNTHY